MKNNWLNKKLWKFSFASFFNDICHEMTTAILPSFLPTIINPSQVPTFLGLIEGISDFLSTCSSLISGWLADRMTFYKPFLIIGYGLTGIFTALMGFAHSVWMILICRSIAWISRGFREPIRDTWLAKITKHQFYGHAFGLNRAMDTLGAVAGPLIAYVLLQYYVSFRSIFFISLPFGLISVVPLLFLKEKKEHSKEISFTFLHTFKQLNPEFKYFLFTMLIFGIANFNRTFLIYRSFELMSGTKASTIVATGWTILLYVFFNCVRGISEFGMGALSDVVNRKNLLAIFGFGVFGLVSIVFSFKITQLWPYFILFALAGLSTGTVKSLEKSYAATVLPEDIRGTGLGALQTIDGIGDLLSSIIVGILWSTVSSFAGFAYAAILSFFAMVLLIIKK